MPHADLRNYYSESDSFLIRSIEQGGSVVFDRSVLPPPPALLSTPDIHISRASHIYEDYYRVDSLWVQCQQEVYRSLGLLILSSILNPTPEGTALVLHHRHTDFTRLVIRQYRSRTVPNGYLERGVTFEYARTEIERYPWVNLHTRINPDDLPCFFLPVELQQEGSATLPQRYGTIHGFGSDRGAILLAQLLLDIGLSEADDSIYDLEGEAGNRGCGPLSAEARFILPGSPAWDESLWES